MQLSELPCLVGCHWLPIHSVVGFVFLCAASIDLHAVYHAYLERGRKQTCKDKHYNIDETAQQRERGKRSRPTQYFICLLESNLFLF